MERLMERLNSLTEYNFWPAIVLKQRSLQIITIAYCEFTLCIFFFLNKITNISKVIYQNIINKNTQRNNLKVHFSLKRIYT